MRPQNDRQAQKRRHSLDPLGKRALFEAPVAAAPDTLRAGRERQGREALFSTGPRQFGTVVVDCSACKVRSRTSLADIGLRLFTGSAWLPGREYSHWMRCPTCGHRTWCSVGWND